MVGHQPVKGFDIFSGDRLTGDRHAAFRSAWCLLDVERVGEATGGSQQVSPLWVVGSVTGCTIMCTFVNDLP